jgi:hypothetical protein
MATVQMLREIEDDCPWLRADFQAGLAELSESTADQARRFACDMHVLAELVAQVPRCPNDDRGATPWTSFRREVAVARRLSDQGAAAEIRCATALTGPMRRAHALLAEGRITVQRARVFVTELEGVDEAVAAAVDEQLAERVAVLAPWRIRQEARRAVLTADPDEAARRTAQQNDGRSVSLQPQPDDQACVMVSGPAVPLTRWYATLDRRARTLKAAGDPRTLDQLRFDLAVTGYPCDAHVPAGCGESEGDAADRADAAAVVAAGLSAVATANAAEAATPAATATADAGLRPSFVEPAASDCRRSRPVQASVVVPVETALGLSNEPAWLDGYGWISAPTCRLLLVDAELRRVCVQTGTGQLVDVAERDVRPPPTPAGLRSALVELVVEDVTLSGAATRREEQHDPSPPLRALVELRDRFDDGPTGTRRAATRCELDHDRPYPQAPTAAWNLVARATRTHQLKHDGWTPLRTASSTLWFTPAGQLVEVPRHVQVPPGADAGAGREPRLPDPEALLATDLAQLQPRAEQDRRPWLTGLPRDTTRWGWLDTDEPGF